MAFWYTRERMEEGPVFGNRDRWNGLAITFDTFDNDGKVHTHALSLSHTHILLFFDLSFSILTYC
jgi:hypothetical protein